MNHLHARQGKLALGAAWLGAAWLVTAWAGVLPSARASNRAPEEVLLLPWDTSGAGAGAGRITGRQAASEGPKSFAVKPDGGLLVLDQVNLRIQDFDPRGSHLGAVYLPGSTFDDVEQLDGRFILALDRLVTRTLLVMDFSGRPLLELDLEGRGIEQAGLITAMLSRPDGIWLEVRHRYSVKVLDRHGAPCKRQVVLGRPVEEGRSLHGALDDRGGARIWFDDGLGRVASPAERLQGEAPVRRIVWLDADPLGATHAVLHEATFDPRPPYRVQAERYRLVFLDDRMLEAGQAVSPYTLTRFHQRVEFRVGPDGTLWQMAFTDEGVRFIAWRRP